MDLEAIKSDQILFTLAKAIQRFSNLKGKVQEALTRIYVMIFG